jgi:glutamate dehydrogenase/leucine dehydrogenase
MGKIMNTEIMNHGDQVICRVNQGGKLFGILVIHSSYRGTSCGGIRIAPDVEEDEVRWLAEGMTLKFGILGLPQGGAKAGVRSDPDAPWETRLEILKTFGKAILPFLKCQAFLPAADMGTDNEMVRRMLTDLDVPFFIDNCARAVPVTLPR